MFTRSPPRSQPYEQDFHTAWGPRAQPASPFSTADSKDACSVSSVLGTGTTDWFLSPSCCGCPWLPRSHVTEGTLPGPAALERMGEKKSAPGAGLCWVSGHPGGELNPGLADPAWLNRNYRQQAGTGQDRPQLIHTAVRWAGHLPTPSSLKESSGAEASQQIMGVRGATCLPGPTATFLLLQPSRTKLNHTVST